MNALLTLHGVGIPVVSAIVTLVDPQRYGVIDVRAWQVLYHYGAVITNSKGRTFTLKEWLTYLEVIRGHANHFSVSARRIERTL